MIFLLKITNFFYKKKQVFDWLNNLEGLAISEAKEVLGDVLKAQFIKQNDETANAATLKEKAPITGLIQGFFAIVRAAYPCGFLWMYQQSICRLF